MCKTALSLLALCACRYDLDKLYEHEKPAANDLIELWAQPAVDEDCIACAQRECASENAACKDDPECLALTQCVAEHVDPDTLTDCRSDHAAWLAEDVEARALGGPYQTCVFQDQCASKCEGHSDLTCLGQFSWRETSRVTVPMTLRFADALSGDAAPGLTVKVCRIEDLACEDPENGAGAVTDAKGEVKVDVPTPIGFFSGFLEVTGGDFYPTLVQFGWPVSREYVVNVPIINAFSVNANIGLSGATQAADRGILQTRMYGCGLIGVRGVSFTASKADDMSATWYATSDSFPDFEATSTKDLGNGGIINVPVGINQVRATRESDGVLVGRTNAPVRAGYLTVVLMAPLDAQ